MDSGYLKNIAAIAALDFIEPLLRNNSIVGVGTGSTTNLFIDALSNVKQKFDAAVSSSEASTERLKKLGINVIDLSVAPTISFYIDGADEVDLDADFGRNLHSTYIESWYAKFDTTCRLIFQSLLYNRYLNTSPYLDQRFTSSVVELPTSLHSWALLDEGQILDTFERIRLQPTRGGGVLLECGDDGCGGSCGECGEGEDCVSGLCIGDCLPDCSQGKECGSDGCGGTCGECADGEACNEGFCGCVPDCEGNECGGDGCGGECRLNCCVPDCDAKDEDKIDSDTDRSQNGRERRMLK